MFKCSGLFGKFLLAISPVGSAYAVTVDVACPTTSLDMLAIGGAPEGTRTTFCISSYGWSNGWFATSTPGTAPGNACTNLLGDSAQYLSYDLGGTTFSSWLTPTLSISTVGSNFQEVTAITKLNDNEALSVITDNRVNVAIHSKVIRDNIRMTFTIENLTGAPLTAITFIQYLNYFPYGSTNPNQGKITYGPVPTLEDTYVDGLWVSGAPDSNPLVREGGVCGGPGIAGCSTPDAHAIGVPLDVIDDIQAFAFNGVNSSNNNSAGALVWTVNGLNLGQGDSTQFTIELVPEPGTVGLFLVGAAGLLLRRRGLRKAA
jgi:hypothetical protein